MIFYFSGTGNTRFVAKEIAAGIGEDLLFIPDLIREGRYEFALQTRVYQTIIHHPTPITQHPLLLGSYHLRRQYGRGNDNIE